MEPQGSTFDSSGKYLRSSVGRQGNKQGEFIHPTGICFDNNRNILVADSGNNRIQIFSGEGRYMGMFTGMFTRLAKPCGLSLDYHSNANVIVANSGNKVIKIFSIFSGELIMKIGGPGLLSFPIHCVQCGRYLIVSDNIEHSMKVLDQDGNFQYKFGKQAGGDGEFKNPGCLSVDKLGRLIVCDASNHRIQVFELNGKFVGKFGTKGRNLREFNGPWSAAVLSNGQIVASESYNNRIQIFE